MRIKQRIIKYKMEWIGLQITKKNDKIYIQESMITAIKIKL